MGYRSDVQVVMYIPTLPHAPLITTPSDLPILSFAALKLWFDTTYPVREACDEWEADVSYGKDYILVSYTHVKWYGGGDHYNNVMSALELFSAAFGSDEEDGRASWELLRVGDELNDITRDNSAYHEYRLNVSREIIFN
jgi:hypothetical protein